MGCIGYALYYRETDIHQFLTKSKSGLGKAAQLALEAAKDIMLIDQESAKSQGSSLLTPEVSVALSPDAKLERIMFVANAMIPSLLLSFTTPLESSAPQGTMTTDYVTEKDLTDHFKTDFRERDARDWMIDRVQAFNPTLIVFCRYSGPHAPDVVGWANAHRIPTIFHVDDDLLNVPIELGEKKFRIHNAPERLAAIQFLLHGTTLTYCSTKTLSRRFFGEEPPRRVVAGDIYCAHEVLAPPTSDAPQVVGYMGFDHAHDFQLVLPALVRLLDSRPGLIFEMFGSIPIPMELTRFGNRIRTIEPVRDYVGFISKLSSLNWTIGICPLAKTPFNEVKADTKWVEYTASGFAVIASRGTVYDHCCAEGCGWLAEGEDEWLTAFETLLDDQAVHRTQVERAQNRLRQEYSPQQLFRQIELVFAQAHRLNAEDKVVEIKTSPVRLNLEEAIGPAVKGWIFATDQQAAGNELLEISCGDITLGWCERRVSRPDVDAHFQDFTTAKGFMIPVSSLSVLYRLLEKSANLHPRMTFCGEAFSLHDFSAELNALTAFETLQSLDGVHGLHVTDLWWAGSRLLKLRTLKAPENLQGPQPSNLRVYQPLRQPSGELKLVLVEEVLLSPLAQIYPIGVRSPFMPILLVGLSQDGEICFTDLVPFPSLLRGGLHEAEVAALCETGGDLQDLRRLSNGYVAEFLGIADSPPPFLLEAIDIDLSTAVGTEPLFDPALRDWMVSVLGISVNAAEAEERVAHDLDDRTFVDYTIAHLAKINPTESRNGRARLTLPVAAVPTIAALVGRRVSLEHEFSVAPHIVLDPVNPAKRWFVAIPDGGPLVEDPTLATMSRHTFPCLTLIGPTEGNQGGESLLPLAIVFRDLAPPVDPELEFPVPLDRSDILPFAPETSPPSVSVIVMLDADEHDLRALLASLAVQAMSSAFEVILGIARPEWHTAAQRQLLTEILPGRSRVVSGLNGLNASEAMTRAAAAATGDVLVFLDPRMVVHDHRTLATLSRLAALDGIGTVGCMQLKNKNPGKKRLIAQSAGYFPGRCDFEITASLTLREIASGSILPRAVYPVAANSPRCLAVSAHAWRELDGMNTKITLRTYSLVELAVRLAETGRTNICTTLVTVYGDSVDANLRQLDVYTSTQMKLWRLLPAIKSSTLVRSF